MTQIGIIGSSRQRRVGSQALGSVGLGLAPMAMLGIDEAQAIATIHAALDAGVRLLDAATVYTPSVSSPGHSDRLVARALAAWNGPRAEVIHVGKGGHRRVADGLTPSAFIIDGRPESIRADAETTLAAMGTEQIDLYLLHMPDPKVPLAESFGALLDLKREGKARMIGLSNVTLEQVQQVSRLGRIDAVENQYSILPICFSSQLPWTRDQSRPVLDWCESHDVAFLAYSPLGSVEAAGHLASRIPALADVAATHAVSAQRVALAWLLRQSDHLLTIVGCRRVETAVDSALAMQLVLSADEINRIAVSVATSPANKQ
jgi:aryl-alcohol dehydrogenase-like predicted oxidoreductase